MAIGWEERIERFVEARSQAARDSGDDGPHRAWAEGAWFVLELARQLDTRDPADVRRAGIQRLTSWRMSPSPVDHERWQAAAWALEELARRAPLPDEPVPRAANRRRLRVLRSVSGEGEGRVVRIRHEVVGAGDPDLADTLHVRPGDGGAEVIAEYEQPPARDAMRA
ncbi:MAG TPA: hypothetical protein VE991_09180 [Acidimicrobiales bacterium]|nr:hypothetical protein [Acidimicrobiales bacterium]